MAAEMRALQLPAVARQPRAFQTRTGTKRFVAARAQVQQGEAQARTVDLLQLKAALEKAVRSEDYAAAAKLRDQIKGTLIRGLCAGTAKLPCQPAMHLVCTRQRGAPRGVRRICDSLYLQSSSRRTLWHKLKLS